MRQTLVALYPTTGQTVMQTNQLKWLVQTQGDDSVPFSRPATPPAEFTGSPFQAQGTAAAGSCVSLPAVNGARL